jgi:hypothetical protein
MANNPVAGKYPLGVTDKFVILEKQVGLLYKNHKYVRTLTPGEAPTLAEKASGKLKGQEVAVYVVDLKTHSFERRINLPARDEDDLFVTTIKLDYRVSDPAHMVEEDITDTETVLARYLERELRKISRTIPLHKNVRADTEFSNFINNTADTRTHCGLELVSLADVDITLSSEQKIRVEKLQKLERSMEVQQLYTFNDEVPGNEGGQRFEVQVHVTYRVADRTQLTSGNLDEVASNLKPRIMAQLRRVSRRYSIADLADADDAMQEKMEDMLGNFNLFGLEILNISVSTDLDEAARKRYLERVDQQHKSTMKQLEMQGVKGTADVIIELAKNGNMSVLAMAASRNEITMTELYQHLTDHQREQFENQMRILDKFTSDDLLREGMFYEQAGHIARIATENVTGVPVSHAPAITDGRQNVVQPDTGKEPAEDEQ